MSKCLFCGEEIPEGRKFCSISHSASYNNRVNKRKARNKCAYCGKDIPPTVRRQNKFCSSACSALNVFDKKDKEYRDGKIKEPSTLKRHFLAHNDYKCVICGISSWNNKALVLVLDHIDGNPENNHPSNLRLVCPNCDSQLATYKCRNRGRGRAYRRQRYAEGKSF